MKRLMVFLIITVVMLSASSCNSQLYGKYIAKIKRIRVYDADYTKKYEDTLNAMFDNEWTIKSVEERYEEYEEVCSHVDSRPQQFIEWTVEYHDGNSELRTFVFDNRQSLSSQIENYITQYIADYYKENFYDVYIKDVPLAPSSYVYGFFVHNFPYKSYDEVKEMEEKTDVYSKNLNTPEGTICLSKLTPANVFEMCPIYLSINVSFSEYSGDKALFEKKVMNQVEDMIEDMNEFTNNHLTASINIGYHEIVDLHTGNRSYYWTYVLGNHIFNADGWAFDRHVFDGYKGRFW